MYNDNDFLNDEQQNTLTEQENPVTENGGFVEYDLRPQKSKKKKNGSGRVIGLALVCALIGGAVGGGAVYLAGGSGSSDTEAASLQAETEAAETAAESETAETVSSDAESTENSESTSDSSTPLLVTSGTDSGATLTPSEVYEQNVNAVVAITSTTTTTNYFGQASSTASSGSGFIITEDGYVVTNAHVVVDDDIAADSIEVVLTDGESYAAELIGYDSDNDVALLKIEASGLDTVTIGDSDELVVGEMVCAIGNPLGELTNTLTVGYVSALDREINTDGTPINMLQTDCAINPGNSGGPLFDMNGNVIGITTAKYSSSSDTTLEGLGFALPINDVMEIVADLQQYGYVTGKPYLGISLTDLSVTMASYYNLPVGVYINSVVEGSCAETAGVQAGDIITGMGDAEIQTYTELSEAMRDYSAGDTTTLTVYRNGEYIELTVTFDEKVPDYVTSAEETVEEEAASESENGMGQGGFGSGSSGFGSVFGSSGSGTAEDSGSAA